MAFWLVLCLSGAGAALWMARPFLRRGAVEINDADGAISIFRDQIDEVARDEAAGLISAEEAGAARREIERRALMAARSLDSGMSVSKRSAGAAAGLTGLAAVAVVGLYAVLGTPEAPDQPLAARRTEVLEQRAAAGDVASRIALLIDRVAEDPQSFEDWWQLAKAHAAVGDHASSAEAYRHAAELGGDQPGVQSAYAEAMTLANGNKVPVAARVIFEQVLQKGPEPRARYYVALAKAQAQDFEAALEDWVAFARESEPDAPWMPLVRRDIANMARFLDRDVTEFLPDAGPVEVARSGVPADPEAVKVRIGEVEAALAEDPKDYKGWIALAELWSALGRDETAARALDAGREHYAAAPFVLQKFDETARALGLDMLAGPGVSGPTEEDVAAASALSQDEQADMIAGMVAGLAAKLEENPDNPEGWIMLVRSYSVMGDLDKAETSYRDALAHFEGNETVLARLRADAGAVIGAN